MNKQLGAFVVWHSHEYGDTPYLVITYDRILDSEWLSENIFTSEYEPDKGETVDTADLAGAWLVVDNVITQCEMTKLINAFDPDIFALMGWRPGDVQSHRPGWSDEKARQWLQYNAKHLRDRLCELGNQVIGDLLPPPAFYIEWGFKKDGHGFYVDLFKDDEEESEVSWTQNFSLKNGNRIADDGEQFATSFINMVAKNYGVPEENITRKGEGGGEDRF